MDGYSQPTADSMDDCLKDQPQSGYDERRGVHLLSPGDLVRYRGDMWNVTGIHLSTDRRFSVVTLEMDGDRFGTQLTIPISLIEGACEVYLRATASRAS